MQLVAHLPHRPGVAGDPAAGDDPRDQRGLLTAGMPNLDGYMAALSVFLSLLLIVRSNLDSPRMGVVFHAASASRVGCGGSSSTWGSVLAAVVALISGWNDADSNDLDRTDRESFREFLQLRPQFSTLSEFWNRLFSPIDAQGPDDN